MSTILGRFWTVVLWFAIVGVAAIGLFLLWTSGDTYLSSEISGKTWSIEVHVQPDEGNEVSIVNIEGMGIRSSLVMFSAFIVTFAGGLLWAISARHKHD